MPNGIDQDVVDGSLVPCVCPRCRAAESRPVLSAPDRQFAHERVFRVGKCLSCGLLYQTPRIPLDRLAEHYPGDYAPYAGAEIELDQSVLWHLKANQGYSHLCTDIKPSGKQRRSGAWDAQIQLIPDFVADGCVLEIGCASGNRLAMLRRLGWSVCRGNEYSEGAAQRARERGLDIMVGPIEQALESYADDSFDAIIGSFVIEHLPDPFETTRALAKKLKRGGQFRFSTINVSSLDFWLYGAHWYDLDLPRHMVFFRPQDLRAMLSEEFIIEKTNCFSEPADYQGSARYRARDGTGGWRGAFDAMVLGVGERIGRPLRLLGRAGFGGRAYLVARKK